MRQLSLLYPSTTPCDRFHLARCPTASEERKVCDLSPPVTHAISARRRHRRRPCDCDKGRNCHDKGRKCREKGRHRRLSHSRYTSRSLVWRFSAPQSQATMTRSPPSSLPTSPCTTRTAATSSTSPPLPAILGRPEDAGRAEDASEHEIRSARAGAAAAISCSASPSPSLPCSHSPLPPNPTIRCLAHDPTTRPLRAADPCLRSHPSRLRSVESRWISAASSVGSHALIVILKVSVQ